MLERVLISVRKVPAKVVVYPPTMAAYFIPLLNQEAYPGASFLVFLQVQTFAVVELINIWAGRYVGREWTLIEDSRLAKHGERLQCRGGIDVPVHHYAANAIRNIREIRRAEHVDSEVAQKRVEQHTVGASLEIAEGKIDVQYVTCSMFLLAGDESSRRLQKYFTVVVTGGLKAGIIKLSVEITHQNFAIVSVRRSGMQCDTAQRRVLVFYFRGCVSSWWNRQPLHRSCVAPDAAGNDALGPKSVIQRVIDARQ